MGYYPPMSDEEELKKLANRYIDLWQDQVMAVAEDPETIKLMERSMSFFNQGMANFNNVNNDINVGREQTKQGKSTPRPPQNGSETSAAAPDSADVDFNDIMRCLKSIETRLDKLEASSKGTSSSS